MRVGGKGGEITLNKRIHITHSIKLHGYAVRVLHKGLCICIK